MIQFIRHIDAQQFQCGAQRKNQRGSGARLKFTTTDQRLSLDTQQTDLSRFGATAIRLRHQPRSSMFNGVHVHTVDASLSRFPSEAGTDNVVRR
ncbi:hypothetical protein [Bifidobacterium thermophilum]|uniref:hypothetical protein n=1 Tax=Bifidobacterium thermophilum TaxID=33905 RepID=UPI0039923261